MKEKTIETKKIEVLKKYAGLKARSDAENRILSLNYDLNDKVYNSLPDGDRLKEAIRTRKLKEYGFSQEEFIELYEKARWELDINEKTMALIKAIEAEEKDRVPVRISPEILARAGHKESYLLQVCREYHLTTEQLVEVLDIKDRYRSDVPTVLKLREKGWSLDDISTLMEVRENVVGEIDSVTLNTLEKLARQFCSGDGVDADELLELVEKIDSGLQTGDITWKDGVRMGLYLGTAIANCVKLAREKGIADLDTALDYFTLELSDSPEELISIQEREPQ